MKENKERIITINTFHSKHLNNNRDINIYLPESYHKYKRKPYPVLYMHDGQNIFEDERSYSGVGWKIHHIHDELVSCGMIRELIIIGIDNIGKDRLSEYAHSKGSYKEETVEGRGKLYERFLIDELKPYIDSNFRTLKEPEDTGLMGSSMGGFATFNIGFRNPDIFGKLGIISPSFWWNTRENIKTIDEHQDVIKKSRMWIDMGTKEGNLDKSFDKVVKHILSKHDKSSGNIEVNWIIGAAHTEADWQRRVQWPLIHLFGR